MCEVNFLNLGDCHEAIRSLRNITELRGQLIAKLGKRIHAQRETISKLQGDRDAIGSRLDAFIEQAQNDSHTMAAARHQIKALLETVTKLKAESTEQKNRLVELEALYQQTHD